MNIEDFRRYTKSDFDIENEKIVNEVFNQLGYKKYFILGEINILRSFLDTMGNNKITREDLIKCLKIISEDNEWARPLITTIK